MSQRFYEELGFEKQWGDDSACGMSIDGEITARQTPECASDPTSRYARFVGNPQCAGGSGNSSQSN